MVETITLGTPIGSARMPCVASEVPPEPPAEIRPPRSRRVQHEALEGQRHRGDRAAAVAAEHGRLAVRVVARHLARVHAGRRRLARGREVDRDHAQAELFQALAQEEQLAALGVEGAGDVGGAPAAGGDREVEAPAARRRGRAAAARCAAPARRRRARDVGHRRGGAAGVPAGEAAHACPAPGRRATARRRHARGARSTPASARGVGRGGRRVGASASSSARRSARRAAAPAARGRRPAAAAGISCAMRPLTITPMRSATSIATPRFCSISSTAISPSAASSRSACATCSTITGARPSVGSSITSSRGFEQQRAADRQHLLLAARQLRAAVAACARPGAGTSRRRGRPRACAARPGAASRRPTARARRAGPAARRRCRAA